jgi:hypothetical protein
MKIGSSPGRSAANIVWGAVKRQEGADTAKFAGQGSGRRR